MEAINARYERLRNYCDPFCGMEKLFEKDNPLPQIIERTNNEAFDCEMLLARINEVNAQEGHKDFISKMAKFGIAIAEPSTSAGGTAKDAEMAETNPDDTVPKGNPDEKKPTAAAAKPQPKAVIETITKEEMEQIPKYMRGRLVLEDINKVIDCLNKYLTQKRKLLRAPMKQMSLADRDKVAAWKSEINDGGDGMFIEEAQLRSLLPDKSKLHLKPVLPILRHLGRTKEVRNKGNKISIHIVLL